MTSVSSIPTTVKYIKLFLVNFHRFGRFESSSFQIGPFPVPVSASSLTSFLTQYHSFSWLIGSPIREAACLWLRVLSSTLPSHISLQGAAIRQVCFVRIFSYRALFVFISADILCLAGVYRSLIGQVHVSGLIPVWLKIFGHMLFNYASTYLFIFAVGHSAILMNSCSAGPTRHRSPSPV